MSKRIKLIIVGCLLLLIGTGVWINRAIHSTKNIHLYSNAYTAENAYKWLVGSGLVDPTVKQIKTKEHLPSGIKSRVLLENHISIIEYTHIQETKTQTHMSNAMSTVSINNITVSMPKDKGNIVDVEHVLIEQKAVPHISKKSF